MKARFAIGPLAASLMLGACATLPSGPAVTALPGSGKNYDAFQQDNIACQGYAQAVLGNGAAPQAVNDRAAAGAVATTAVGAATGAIIGSASNQGGQGAAIGAGVGLLVGAINAANASSATQWQLQRHYDNAYLQCMYAKGNRVPVRMSYSGPPPGYATPYYAPPPTYSAPPANYPPQSYPPQSYPPQSYPPPDYPPPNTPPPKG
jgi:hypothetical protein